MIVNLFQYGIALLSIAAQEGDLRIVQMMLAFQANIDTQDDVSRDMGGFIWAGWINVSCWSLYEYLMGLSLRLNWRDGDKVL